MDRRLYPGEQRLYSGFGGLVRYLQQPRFAASAGISSLKIGRSQLSQKKKDGQVEQNCFLLFYFLSVPFHSTTAPEK